MAIVKRTASQAWREGFVDLEKVKAATEADLAGYLIEEGENPADPLAGYRQKPKTAPRSKRSVRSDT